MKYIVQQYGIHKIQEGMKYIFLSYINKIILMTLPTKILAHMQINLNLRILICLSKTKCINTFDNLFGPYEIIRYNC